jgi:hypothetical protein
VLRLEEVLGPRCADPAAGSSADGRSRDGLKLAFLQWFGFRVHPEMYAAVVLLTES